MGKKRQLTQRIAGLYGQKDVVVQAHGGTNQSDKPDVISQDQIVTKDRIRKPHGLVPLTGNKVALADIDGAGDLLNAIALVGDTEVFTGSINEYFINNHGSDTDYTVSVDFGSAVLSAVDKITYTAPSGIGTANLTVNGNTFTIAVSSSRPRKPTFISPAQNAVNIGRMQLFTADVMTISGPGVPNHDKSDWQIASDSGFTSIVSQTTDDTINKTSWTGTLTTPNTVYYARVRYHDAALGWGAWSNMLVFTTKLNFGISAETARLVPSDATTGDRFGTPVNGFDTGATSHNPVSISKTGTLLGIGSQRKQTNAAVGTYYLFRKNNQGIWSEVKKLFQTDTLTAQSMVLTIPSGGSITVNIQGSSPSTVTYMTSQSITIPAGTTSVVLTGKGQDGNYTPGGGLIWASGAEGMHLMSITNVPVFQTFGLIPPTEKPTYYTQKTTTTDGYSSYTGHQWENYDSVLWVAEPIPGSVSTGANTTATFGGSTYTFSGGVGVPAAPSVQSVALNVTGGSYGTSIAVTVDTNGQEWVAAGMTWGASNDRTVIFKNTGNDNWTVDTTLPFSANSNVGAIIFDFSPNGNRLFVADFNASIRPTIEVYKKTTTWIHDSTIDLTAFGLSPDNLMGRVAINTDGTKIAAVINSTLAADPYRFILLQQSGTTWSIAINTPITDGLPTSASRFGAVYGNASLSVVAFRHPEATAGSGTKEGTVTLYNISGVSLTKIQTLKSPTPVNYGGFGMTVDISESGDTIAISEPNFADDYSFAHGGIHNTGDNWHGKSTVYIFEKSGNTWSLGSTLHGSQSATGDLFGARLSLSGDGTCLAVAGDIRPTGITPSLGGAVYVFQ